MVTYNNGLKKKMEWKMHPKPWSIMMMNWKRKWNNLSSGAAVDGTSEGAALDDASVGAAADNASAGTTADNDNNTYSGAADIAVIIYHQDQVLNLNI